MARTAREVTCSGEEERILNNIASSRTASFSEVLRAKIILYCLQGMPLSHIAKKLDVSLTMVTRWRNRFIESGSKGLVDLHRKGRPSVYTEKFREDVLLIIYFIFKHILLAQNRPESDADGSEVTESLSVIPFQVLSNWKIPDSSSLPFSDNSKLLHPDSNQENTREYVPAKHDHLLLQAKTF